MNEKQMKELARSEGFDNAEFLGPISCSLTPRCGDTARKMPAATMGTITLVPRPAVRRSSWKQWFAGMTGHWCFRPFRSWMI